MMKNDYVLKSLNNVSWLPHVTSELEDYTCIDDGVTVEFGRRVYWAPCESFTQLENGDVILNNCPNTLLKGFVIDGVVHDRLHDDMPVFFLKSPHNIRFCVLRFDSVDGKTVCRYLTLTHDEYYVLFLHYFNAVHNAKE